MSLSLGLGQLARTKIGRAQTITQIDDFRAALDIYGRQYPEFRNWALKGTDENLSSSELQAHLNARANRNLAIGYMVSAGCIASMPFTVELGYAGSGIILSLLSGIILPTPWIWTRGHLDNMKNEMGILQKYQHLIK